MWEIIYIFLNTNIQETLVEIWKIIWNALTKTVLLIVKKQII